MTAFTSSPENEFSSLIKRKLPHVADKWKQQEQENQVFQADVAVSEKDPGMPLQIALIGVVAARMVMTDSPAKREKYRKKVPMT